MTDEQLLTSLRSEPEKAFRALYDRYSGVLLRFIFRFTGNQQAAEEILHDVFIELLDGNFRTVPEAGLKSWLFTVAKNKSLNQQRRLQHDPRPEIEPAADPEAKTLLSAALKQLETSEKNLPEDLRETWELRRQGFGYQEIADQLAIPLGTVKSRFHRLVSYLREEFEA